MLTSATRYPFPAHPVTQPPATAPFGIIGQIGVAATEFCYRRDEEIYGEDEPAEYIYQISTGAVRTFKMLPDGRRQIGAFHLPGDVFGLASGTVHPLTAEAIVETRVHFVGRRCLERAAAADAAIASRLWATTANSLRHAEDHMLLLGRKTAVERVAAFLLEMDRRLTSAKMLALPMSRRDIADYLGLTLETVSRTLSQLHAQGVLDFSGARQITLRNRHSLNNLNA